MINFDYPLDWFDDLSPFAFKWLLHLATLFIFDLGFEKQLILLITKKIINFPIRIFSCLFYFSRPGFLDITGIPTSSCQKEQDNLKIEP